MDHPRQAFRRELESIDAQSRRLFALVSEAVSAATDALLARDAEAARAVIVDDAVIDAIQTDVEEAVEALLMLQQPFASDINYLFTVMRIAPELERCGDLAEHIAQRADPAAMGEIPASLRGRFARMGELTSEMWRIVGDAWAEADPDAGTHLAERDDELDGLHRDLRDELAEGGLPTADAIELALVGRFFERLGDHAVTIARRITLLRGRRPAHLEHD
jgi:phosphate transport system protein